MNRPDVWTINQIDITRQTARYTSSPDWDDEWTLISETDEGKYSKTNEESILLTTGASDEFEAKNIYDVAGNVFEWTMETIGFDFNDDNGPTYNGKVNRGGCFDDIRR